MFDFLVLHQYLFRFASQPEVQATISVLMCLWGRWVLRQVVHTHSEPKHPHPPRALHILARGVLVVELIAMLAQGIRVLRHWFPPAPPMMKIRF